MTRALAAFVVLVGLIKPIEASDVRMILVLPFENRSGRADLGWLSESFANTLSARLAAPRRVVIKRVERDAACLQLGIPPGTPVTLASAITVARSLDADWVVTGNYSTEGETLTARVYLLDLGTLKAAGPFEENGPLNDLAEIETNLAWRILAARAPNFTIGMEEDFRRQFPHIALDAHENYIRGILASDPETRVRFLTEADRRNPADHAAAFELGRFYFSKKDYENSALWLRKVLTADVDFFDARYMMGINEFFLGHEAAAQEIFSGLSRQVPIAEVWNNLGLMQSRAGQGSDAIVSFDRAYQLDPNDPDYCFNLGVSMWNAGRVEVAIRYLREALQSSPDDAEIHRLLRDAHAKTGDQASMQREDTWLEARDENGDNGRAAAIVPSPRLKKTFDRRSYRLVVYGTRPAGELKGQAIPAAPPGEVSP